MGVNASRSLGYSDNLVFVLVYVTMCREERHDIVVHHPGAGRAPTEGELSLPLAPIVIVTFRGTRAVLIFRVGVWRTDVTFATWWITAVICELPC